MSKVDKPHISLPILLRNEDGLLATKPGQGVPVALDAGAEQAQIAQDLLGPASIDHAGVEPLQLAGQDGREV